MKFLVFEGLDGAGKSTLIKKVQEELSRRGVTYQQVRDPGGPSVSERLREIILDPDEKPLEKTEVLMYQAARAELVGKQIAPALKQGQWVLSDRFYSSTIAFQSEARGLDRTAIDWLNNYACSGLKPDLVIFIDITVEESQKRLHQRCGQTGTVHDRMELEKEEFHQKVRQGYLKQANSEPSSWLVLDGLKSPEGLFADVVKYLEENQWLA